MGNFASSPKSSIQQGFEDLAMLLSNFPTVASKARFIFIPGPNDSGCSLLPQAPLVQELPSLQKTMESYQIKNVHWGSNPCRVRRNGKEIVLFRYDVLAWILQNQLRLPQRNEIADRTPHSRMVKTILDQGHLLPVARAPIYWNYDHAMRLYPLPDALVIGGSTAREDYEIYEKCDSIHPGSFSKDGTYTVYSLNEMDSDAMNDDDHDDQESGKGKVEFCRVTTVEN
jgi:DNA polymerase epsilon subunit 2